jgi:OmpA-OmpF porin, OOP family
MSTRITMAAGACVAAALTLSGASAQAQTLYFGAEGGWTHLNSQTSRATGFPTLRTKFEDGFVAGGKIGYEMGPWRFEEEYAYRANDISSMTFGGVAVPGAKGNRQSHAIMTNLYYQFTLPWTLPLTPYVGAGVGAVDVIDQATTAPGFGGKFADDSDWQLGYQAMGGLRYNFTPRVAFDVEYRYFATTDPTFRVRGRTNTYKTGYDTHNVMASLVYRWLPPPAPPPVAVPPAPLPPPPPPPVFRGERG